MKLDEVVTAKKHDHFMPGVDRKKWPIVPGDIVYLRLSGPHRVIKLLPSMASLGTHPTGMKSAPEYPGRPVLDNGNVYPQSDIVTIVTPADKNWDILNARLEQEQNEKNASKPEQKSSAKSDDVVDVPFAPPVI